MEQLQGTYQYTEESSTLGFAPGDTHYTIPDGYWVNAKYRVEVTPDVKSAGGSSCAPYTHDMVGAQVEPLWITRNDGWWGMNNVVNYEFPFTQSTDYYGNIDSWAYMLLIPHHEVAPESFAPWWIGETSPIAIRLTYTSVNPTDKLYMKFHFWANGSQYAWTSGAVDSDTIVDLMPMIESHAGFEEVQQIELITADKDPFDSYLDPPAVPSVFTITNIDLLQPQELFGWVDITDQKYWNISHGTFGQNNTYVSAPNEGPWIVMSTAGGLYLPGHCPTKMRITFTADKPVTPVNDYTMGLYSSGIDSVDFNSGVAIDIDTSVYSTNWDGTQEWYMSVPLEIWPLNLNEAYADGDFTTFTITKIEVYQKIPKTVEFWATPDAENHSPEKVDVIIPGVLEITRDREGGAIYNLAKENSYGGGDFEGPRTAPEGTLWAFDGGFNGNPQGADFSLSNLSNLVFAPFAEACGDNPPNIVGWKSFCHIVELNLYVEFMWTAWGQGGGGEFGYIRQIVSA